VILEDQKRPRRCGHADGKQVLPLSEEALVAAHQHEEDHG
jgi:2-methylisocitrate lyase-like PEP mutase family enzyme